MQAFQYFQGVPQRISYDNLKAAVQRILEGRTRQEQQKFIVFRSHYLFESRFCSPGQGHEKGRVEGGLRARNFMVPPPEVASFAELNAQLLQNFAGTMHLFQHDHLLLLLRPPLGHPALQDA